MGKLYGRATKSLTAGDWVKILEADASRTVLRCFPHTSADYYLEIAATSAPTDAPDEDTYDRVQTGSGKRPIEYFGDACPTNAIWARCASAIDIEIQTAGKART